MARRFAATFDPPRVIVWTGEMLRFQFVGGTKTYKITMIPRGWGIEVVEEGTAPCAT